MSTMRALSVVTLFATSAALNPVNHHQAVGAEFSRSSLLGNPAKVPLGVTTCGGTADFTGTGGGLTPSRNGPTGMVWAKSPTVSRRHRLRVRVAAPRAIESTLQIVMGQDTTPSRQIQALNS